MPGVCLDSHVPPGKMSSKCGVSPAAIAFCATSNRKASRVIIRTSCVATSSRGFVSGLITWCDRNERNFSRSGSSASSFGSMKSGMHGTGKFGSKIIHFAQLSRIGTDAVTKHTGKQIAKRIYFRDGVVSKIGTD